MKNEIEYFRRKLLSEIEEEKQMCPECYGPMNEGVCMECGYMEEVDYEKSGLAHPEKADRDKNKDISSWEKKVGAAIEKNMSEEGYMGTQYDSSEDMAVDMIKKGIHEEDHEVSMAHSSLEAIIEAAQELMMKMGEEERNIPGWIQDHITNAENYISQAAKGFHELQPEVPQEVELSSIVAEILSESKKKVKKPIEKPVKKKKTK